MMRAFHGRTGRAFNGSFSRRLLYCLHYVNLNLGIKKIYQKGGVFIETAVRCVFSGITRCVFKISNVTRFKALPLV